MSDVDWGDGLDFGDNAKEETSSQSFYPPELRHVLFEWDVKEEDLQCAALGWLLLWRKNNAMVLLPPNDGHFSKPLPQQDQGLWKVMKPRILDWAWLERGGLSLDDTHNMLIKRHHLRIRCRHQ